MISFHRLLTPATLALLMLGSCAQPNEQTGAADPATEQGLGAGPTSFENCGVRVTLEAHPEKVVIIGSNSVSLLEAAGALDRVTAKAGDFPVEIYSDSTARALDAIPTITKEEAAMGTVQISLEQIIDREPDLVIGYQTETITRDALAQAGIPMIIIPAFCPDDSDRPARPDFDSVYEQVAFYGEIFGTQQTAAEAVAELKERVAAVEGSVRGRDSRKAATLFIPLGGGSLSAYGTASISNEQMATVGLSNVFGDIDKRVFETSPEELLARQPEALILLHIDGSPDDIREAVRALPGASGVPAIFNNQMYVSVFDYTDPPSPLSVDGLERLAAHFGTGR